MTKDEAQPPFSLPMLVLCALAPVLCLLPFITKPIHIDDPLFIWTAQHILQTPLDFYGFDVNWYRSAAPIFEVQQNPPGLSYYFAAIAALLGWTTPADWSESILHILMFLPAALCGAMAYTIARHFTPNASLAALLATLNPAFLVSASTLMSDIPMLAFFLCSIATWLHGLKTKSYGWLFLGAILIIPAFLCKYFALISLIPLLAAAAILLPTRNFKAIPLLILPLLALLAYEYHCIRLYGQGHFLHTLGYTESFIGDDGTGETFLTKIRITLQFMLVLAPAMFLIPIINLIYPKQFIKECSAALKSLNTHFLILWIGGTLVFVLFINHFINARILLPLLVPGTVVLFLGNSPLKTAKKIACYSILFLSTVLSVITLQADYFHAWNAHNMAMEAPKYIKEGTLWFSGHWGFQYYLEQYGGEAYDLEQSQLKSGDVFILPKNNTNLLTPPTELIQAETCIEFPATPLGILMNKEANAGFYSHLFGAWPYIPGLSEPERLVVYEIDIP